MPGQRRHVAGAVDEPVEQPAHRLLRLQHRVQIAHGIAPLRAAPERQVGGLIGRKLGAVSKLEHREPRDEGLRRLDAAEVPGGGVGQSSPGAMLGVAAAADLGVEPAVHVEQQVLEAALGHQHLDPHRERMVVDPLLRRAAPFHASSLVAPCSWYVPRRGARARASMTRGSVPVTGGAQLGRQARAWSRITA